MSNHKQIIFDEFEKAQAILKNGFDGNMISRYQISVLAKYYFSLGMDDKKLKDALIVFCKQHVKDFNEIVYRGLLLYAMNNAKKYFLKTGKKPVVITKTEMDIIKTCPKNYAKILFTLIAFAKYDKYYPSNNQPDRKPYDGFYSNNRSLKEIMRLCGLPISGDNAMDAKYWLMKETGYATSSRIFKDNWKVLIIDELSEPEITILDIGKIMDYFPYYCEKCGKILEKKAKRHSMCQMCYDNKRKDDIKNNVKNYRKNVIR